MAGPLEGIPRSAAPRDRRLPLDVARPPFGSTIRCVRLFSFPRTRRSAILFVVAGVAPRTEPCEHRIPLLFVLGTHNTTPENCLGSSGAIYSSASPTVLCRTIQKSVLASRGSLLRRGVCLVRHIAAPKLKPQNPGLYKDPQGLFPGSWASMKPQRGPHWA